MTRSVSSPRQGRGLGGRGVQDESRTECHGGAGGDRRVPGHRPAEALGRSTMVGQALSGGGLQWGWASAPKETPFLSNSRQGDLKPWSPPGTGFGVDSPSG